MCVSISPREKGEDSPVRSFKNIKNYNQLDPFSKNLYLYILKYLNLISKDKRKAILKKYKKLDIMANSLTQFMQDIKRSRS